MLGLAYLQTSRLPATFPIFKAKCQLCEKNAYIHKVRVFSNSVQMKRPHTLLSSSVLQSLTDFRILNKISINANEKVNCIFPSPHAFPTKPRSLYVCKGLEWLCLVA